MATRVQRRQDHDVYLDLILRFPLRPIRSDKELNQATQTIDFLIDKNQLQPGEKDYLDVLSDLVERFETEHHPIPQLPDAELLQHLIETKGVSQAEVGRATHIAESTISEVLARKRKLSRAHIGKLARYFCVEPGAFTYEE